jgi:hypothetical protein
MEFKDWFFQKYVEWRGRSRRSLAGFAAHLGVSQAIASNSANGHRAGPEGYPVITAIPRKYPEVYGVLGLPMPYATNCSRLQKPGQG